ncbi:Putative ribosomal N-acetyltransferase YdaF [Oceanobacillus picturae]|uniref:Ribosomal N-acetyltransferase YdaF n=1 Tax=Oceanobacillus picturae TaxID=171693 RepID=W9AGL7_9BACI|nr:GNAT family N-acetyltransferase [Oceanobacillus picturae]CDO04598.1 Putative ribosomal N-acetyltransferase YdaF [Oceanobacillus picturae]
MIEQIDLKEIPVLDTEHYVLRGVEEEDAKELYLFMGDQETMQYITPHPVGTETAMQEEVTRYLEKFALKKEIPWVILDKETRKVVGQFRFHKLHLWHKKAEMGAVIRKEYQNKGVMTEVLDVVLDFGFHTLRLNRIVGDIFAGNEGSRRLMERFGFKREGVLRQTDFDGEKYHDTVVYSLLQAEYRRK